MYKLHTFWPIHLHQAGPLRFESLCMTILFLYHDIAGMPDQENHHPAYGWRINFSSSRETPYHNSAKDYPEVRDSAYWNPVIEAHHINMAGPARGISHNSSSKHPTIGGSEASNAQTQQQYCSESKSRLQHSEALDNHGVNSVDGPTGLSARRLSPTRG
jgi:hypothetical protein